MEDFQKRYLRYKELIDTKLHALVTKEEPRTLYEPLCYILSGGGKRIRPMLVLLACEATGGNLRNSLNAGVAVEVLHNFTLVHDDIMDNADSRRGRATVHKRWDENVAILVGDGLIGLAYKSLLKTQSERIQEIVNVFTDAMIEVCEGQSFDKEFETRDKVTLDEYLMMITKKTGKLVEVSAHIGALIGNGSSKEVRALQTYARHLGTAFQIQDDLLDIVGSEREFGKTIGGDLIEGKKTYLLIQALERIGGKDRKIIQSVVANHGLPKSKVQLVKQIYERHGIIALAKDHIRSYTDKAVQALNNLCETNAKGMLLWFAEMLLNRSF
jgi:geranylgeranyl diphosphate synthase type II